MATQTVLMYHCDDPQWAKLVQIFMILKIRMIPVRPEQYGLTLEQVLQRSQETATVEEELTQPMLVFCHFPDGALNHLLDTMKRSGLPPIPLKAMLTATNRHWNAQELWTELRREHEMLTGTSSPQSAQS